MAYYCTDPERNDDAYALPDVEVFEIESCEIDRHFINEQRKADYENDDPHPASYYKGWWYAFGFPGCLWDGEPTGPYPTEGDALYAAREVA